MTLPRHGGEYSIANRLSWQRVSHWPAKIFDATGLPRRRNISTSYVSIIRKQPAPRLLGARWQWLSAASRMQSVPTSARWPAGTATWRLRNVRPTQCSNSAKSTKRLPCWLPAWIDFLDDNQELAALAAALPGRRAPRWMRRAAMKRYQRVIRKTGRPTITWPGFTLSRETHARWHRHAWRWRNAPIILPCSIPLAGSWRAVAIWPKQCRCFAKRLRVIPGMNRSVFTLAKPCLITAVMMRRGRCLGRCATVAPRK